MNFGGFCSESDPARNESHIKGWSESFAAKRSYVLVTQSRQLY